MKHFNIFIILALIITGTLHADSNVLSELSSNLISLAYHSAIIRKNQIMITTPSDKHISPATQQTKDSPDMRQHAPAPAHIELPTIIKPTIQPQIHSTNGEKKFKQTTFNSWYKKCKNLTLGQKLGFAKQGILLDVYFDPKRRAEVFKEKAVDWDEMQYAIAQFRQVNIDLLNKENNWLADAPKATDNFFTKIDAPLNIALSVGEKGIEANLIPNAIRPFVQKLVIKPGTKVVFHGDFHGDVHSMVEYIKYLNDKNFMNGFSITDPNFYLVFLGDYEDRGSYGVEVWYTLIRLKIANPEKVIIVRGNHEEMSINEKYGFFSECEHKFGNEKDYYELARIFDFLPVALFLGCKDNYLLCVHGGIEQAFNPYNLLSSQLKTEYEWLKVPSNNLSEEKKFPKSFGEIGFMWGDFQVDPKYPTSSGRGKNTFNYSKRDTQDYLSLHSNIYHQLKGIFRAHQHSASREPMMLAILDGQGIAKLWPNEINKDKNLWDNIVCTFLVSPDTPYGLGHKYTWDAFGILTLTEKYEDWRLDMYKNEVIQKNSDL